MSLASILNISNEDYEEGAVAESTVSERVGQALAGSEVVEAQAEGEMGDVGADVNSADVAMDVVSDVTSNSENIVARAQEIAEDKGGLSQEGYSMMRVALEAMHAMIGSNFKFPSTVSVESFSGSMYDRMEVTNVALEAAEEGNKTLWEKTKAFFVNLWERIKKFFKLLFSSKERMKRNVGIALQVAKDSKDVQIKASEFSNIKKVIGYEGINNCGGDIAKFPEQFTKQLNNTVEAYKLFLDITVDAVRKVTYKGFSYSVSEMGPFTDRVTKEVMPLRPIIGGLFIDPKKKIGMFDPQNDVKYVENKNESTMKEDSTVSIKALAKGLEEAFKLYSDYLDTNKQYDDAQKKVLEAFEEGYKNKEGFMKKAGEDANVVMRQFVKMDAGKVTKKLMILSPSKYAGRAIYGLNVVAKTIIKKADKDAQEKNEKNIQEVAKNEVKEPATETDNK